MTGRPTCTSRNKEEAETRVQHSDPFFACDLHVFSSLSSSRSLLLYLKRRVKKSYQRRRNPLGERIIGLFVPINDPLVAYNDQNIAKEEDYFRTFPTNFTSHYSGKSPGGLNLQTIGGGGGGGSKEKERTLFVAT